MYQLILAGDQLPELMLLPLPSQSLEATWLVGLRESGPLSLSNIPCGSLTHPYKFVFVYKEIMHLPQK